MVGRNGCPGRFGCADFHKLPNPTFASNVGCRRSPAATGAINQCEKLPQSGRTGGASTVVIPERAAFAKNVAYHLLVGPKAERGRNKSLQRESPSSDHRGCLR